jgi:hypothetical protein
VLLKVAMQPTHRLVVTRLDVVDEYGNLGTPAHDNERTDAITHPESATPSQDVRRAVRRVGGSSLGPVAGRVRARP